MEKFRLHPIIIDIISEIHQNERATLHLNNEIMTNINVTSGIIESRNGSTSLFLLRIYL